MTPPLTTLSYAGVEFPVDDSRPDEPARIVLGVRKSGSSMFNIALRKLALINGANWVDLPGTLFRHNLGVARWRTDPAIAGLLRGGNAYGGFRDHPAGMADAPLFRDALKAFLVRDPRDALVSEYFSVAHSHSLPPATAEPGAREQLLRMREAAQAMTVDDFARANAGRMNETLVQYAPVLAGPRLLLLRYEEVVFDKRAMLTAALAHFGWSIRPRQLDALLDHIDVRPAAENPHAFIRRVTPGDHREKLSPATLAEVERTLAPALTLFGYA